MRNSKHSEGRMLAACCAVLLLLPSVRIAAGKDPLSLKTANLGAASAILPHYRFTAGKRAIYRLTYSGTARTDFRALMEGGSQSASGAQPEPSGLVQAFRATVHGQWLVTVVSIKGENVVLSYSLRGAVVKLSVNGQEDGADEAAIKNDLSRDVFAALDPRGRVLSVRFNPATGKLSQSVARALLGATQFVFPSEESDRLNRWEAQEEDPNGQYVARYELTSGQPADANAHAGGSVTFQKTITRYLPAITKTSPTELNVETKITPAGSLTVTFDQNNGRVSALSGAETQTIEIAGKTVAHSQSTLELNCVGAEVLGPAKLAALRAANSRLEKSVAATPLSASVSKEESEASIERTELATDNLEALLADLTRLESASGDKNETPLYLKFKALIYLHPESSAALGRMLATADANSLTMRVLTGALGAVGSPEAQAALVSAIKARPTDWPALSMLIPELDDAGPPTPLAEETIAELASQSPNPDIASTALLTLGVMARNLAEPAPERAAKIIASFVEQINLSTSDDRTKLLLLALGNAGSAQAYPTVAKFTMASTPALRATAAWALRWVDSGEAEAQLIKVLASDPEANVRLEAAKAFGFRQINSGSFEAQKQALMTDKDAQVRLALLRNLWKVRAAFPEARKLMEELAKSDASEDVRKAAAELLATEPTH